MSRPLTGNELTVENRFWSKVDKSGDCWVWTSTRNYTARGEFYGRFHFNGKQTLAHRVAWQLTNGEIPGGKFICHHCDNPSCVRPSHLFISDAAGNMRDMTMKGRGKPPKLRGSKHPNSVLCELDVLLIRDLVRTQAQKDVAGWFGVCAGTVSMIVSRKTWVHV